MNQNLKNQVGGQNYLIIDKSFDIPPPINPNYPFEIIKLIEKKNISR